MVVVHWGHHSQTAGQPHVAAGLRRPKDAIVYTTDNEMASRYAIRFLGGVATLLSHLHRRISLLET